jgi:hypothetical protein
MIVNNTKLEDFRKPASEQVGTFANWDTPNELQID